MSEDRAYRYRLWRTWDPALPSVLWVMLNPSTADETKDDLTVKKCQGFAKRWGYGNIEVVNLFALRATNPRELSRHPDPIGPMNMTFIEKAISRTALIVGAWGGSFPKGFDQHRYQVECMLSERYAICLGHTQDGAPRHPSRLGYATSGVLL